MIAGVLLAAGEASRFGGAKLGHPLPDGTPIGVASARNLAGAGLDRCLAVVAPGIAEALIATAFGLGAAIPAVVAYNVLTRRVENHHTRLENFADELTGVFERQARA